MGDSQGAPEMSSDPTQSVIEGRLAQYETSSLFGVLFFYSRFDEAQCDSGSV